MKIIKKNQLAILVISLMLITAGYLNYNTGYTGQSMDASTKIDENASSDLAALGDAELVNTNIVEENKGEEEGEVPQNTPNENEQAPTPKIEKETNGVPTSLDDNYFVTSKLERNVMYSQMTSRYQEIISSNTQAAEQKAVAQQEINKINELQNAIMIAENLLTSKGFSQNVIFVNGTSINVIIGKENLGAEEVAQVQNIVSRELKAEVENIHISTK